MFDDYDDDDYDFDDDDFDDDTSDDDDTDNYDAYAAAVEYYGYDPEDPETYDADAINDFYNFDMESPGIEVTTDEPEIPNWNMLVYSVDKTRSLPALFVQAGMGLEENVFISSDNKFYYVLKAVALLTEKEYHDNPILRIVVTETYSEDGTTETGFQVVRQMAGKEGEGPSHATRKAMPLSPNDPSHVDYIPP